MGGAKIIVGGRIIKITGSTFIVYGRANKVGGGSFKAGGRVNKVGGRSFLPNFYASVHFFAPKWRYLFAAMQNGIGNAGFVLLTIG